MSARPGGTVLPIGSSVGLWTISEKKEDLVPVRPLQIAGDEGYLCTLGKVFIIIFATFPNY